MSAFSLFRAPCFVVRLSASNGLGEGRLETFEHQGAFSRAADASHQNQPAKGKTDGEVLQIVLARMIQCEPSEREGRTFDLSCGTDFSPLSARGVILL